ncbi:MAG: cobalamin-dependent protein [Anaerohalosphaeraceae bacterium]|nr:cobalamin-dependent protein [Anaerohalosphaeraceae bacterium]
MISENYLNNYLQALLTGDRRQCRGVIEDILHNNRASIVGLYSEVIWPIMLEVERLYKSDTITSAQEHMASRINRSIVDQLQNKLPRQAESEKKVAICTASAESGELGGQIISDMFESAGWNVRFLGGGMTNDEILAFVNEFGPDFLVIYGSTASQAPDIRAMIDRVREVNAWPDMKIMLSGGVFARAEGLWEEIGADMFAETATEAVEFASNGISQEQAPVRTINKRKRKQSQAS